MHEYFCSLQCNYITICVIVCTVSPRAWPQAGQHQDHPVCLSGAEGPEQRLVPSVAGDLPAAAYKTVQNVVFGVKLLNVLLIVQYVSLL